MMLERHFSWQAQHGEVLGDCRSAHCCVFNKMHVKSEILSFRERVVAACQFHGHIMLGSCSNRPSSGGSISRIFPSNLEFAF